MAVLVLTSTKVRFQAASDLQSTSIAPEQAPHIQSRAAINVLGAWIGLLRDQAPAKRPSMSPA